MKSHALALLAGGLLLAGCASSEPPPMAAQPAARLMGAWIVTDTFPAGPVTDMASAPKGQSLRFDSGIAGDGWGGTCAMPAYREWTAPLASALGIKSMADQFQKLVVVLEIQCYAQPFGSYAVMPDGALMTRHGNWVLRLERAAKLAGNPAPMMPDAMMAAPAPMALMPAPAPEPPPAPPPVAEPPKPETPAQLVYLASYNTEAWARKGWMILSARSSALKGAEPVMKNVDIAGKGTMVRLFAPAKDDAQAKSICKDLASMVPDCGAKDRGG
jgi:hypothetical protein